MIKCVFENGSPDSLRHATVASIIVKDNSILLAKRGTFNGEPILEFGKWGLTGGFLDRDENLSECAVREAKEELDIEIKSLRLMHIIDNPNRPAEDRQNIAFTFIAESASEPKMVSEEVTEIKWFDLDSLPQKEDFAFDFYDEIMFYKKYLIENFSIPVVG